MLAILGRLRHRERLNLAQEKATTGDRTSGCEKERETADSPQVRREMMDKKRAYARDDSNSKRQGLAILENKAVEA